MLPAAAALGLLVRCRSRVPTDAELTALAPFHVGAEEFVLVRNIDFECLGKRDALREFEPSAVAGLVVDLAADAERLPAAKVRQAVVEGICLPRLAVAEGTKALSAVLSMLTCANEAFADSDPRTV